MRKILFVSFVIAVCIAAACHAQQEKVRIFVVSSYHREYIWSQETHNGLCAAMLEKGYLDNTAQIERFTQDDAVESSKAIIKKEWMDTKRKYSDVEIAESTNRIINELNNFNPDIVLLGDDNAANYIGSYLLDKAIPVVFWGINGLPTKYDIVDSMERPGHNITGVWQSGYHKESLDFLHKLVPEAKTFAILACDSATARPKLKEIQALGREGKLPLKLVDTVVTNSFKEFKERVLELSKRVDAFFMLNHDTMKDDSGGHVDMLTVGRWYLENIKKPEASHEGQFVKEGMLCAANDSGYNQGYEAFMMATSILEDNLYPGSIKPITPYRGPLMANRIRANMLGISLEDKTDMIDEIVEDALALGGQKDKFRIFVVSSYHKDYLWSQQTNEGFCEAMLKFGYFEDDNQIAEYIKNDYVETSKAVIRKEWMDTKRKSAEWEKQGMGMKVFKIARDFKPDLIFLGDDNAANYVGNQFLDTDIPIVFWGINNTPLKYGLVDALKRPGHNVTGVYQSGYYIESLKFLKAIVPGAKTFAALSVDNPTGRAHYKEIEFLNQEGSVPLKLVETVSTTDFELWKNKALNLQKKVDAFFILHYSGLKDKSGDYVTTEEVAKWYLANIKIPEVVQQRQFLEQGMLCGADDPAYNQGFYAVVIANDILVNGEDPATYPPLAPTRGALMVNTKRADMLGITLTGKMGVEEYIDTMPGYAE